MKCRDCGRKIINGICLCNGTNAYKKVGGNPETD